MSNGDGSICKEATRRYHAAFLLLEIYNVLTLTLTSTFLAFAILTIVALIRSRPASQVAVELVGGIASGAIGTFLINRRQEAKTEADEAFQEMKRDCGQPIADSERERLKFKLFR